MLVNIYAPSGGNKVQRKRSNFFSSLSNRLPVPGPEELVFLGGDFNMTVSSLDRNHASPQRYNCISKIGLTSLLSKLHVQDAWRLANPN